MNKVVPHPIDVRIDHQRIDESENQHDPQRNAREKIIHAKEIGTVQDACPYRDGVPSSVSKNPGIRLPTIDWNEISRTGWHSFSSRCVGIHNIDRQIQSEIF